MSMNRSEPSMRRGNDASTETGALKRGFAILEILLEATHPMTARELAGAAGLSDSTVHRLLQSLCEAGQVVRDGARRYHASGKAFLPLTIYHPLNVLRRDSFEPLRALRDEFGVTSSILIFFGFERLLLDVLGVTGMLAPYYGTRLDNPLHVSAAGKLLLSPLSVAERDSVMGSPPYEMLTARTITSRSGLADNLSQAAAQGFATNIDENFIGFSAIAAPLMVGPGRVVGCLALAGGTERFTAPRIRQMGNNLRDSAQLISSGSQSLRAIHAVCTSSP